MTLPPKIENENLPAKYQSLLKELDQLRSRVNQLESQQQEFKKVHAELRKSEELYRSLADNIPDLVYSLNENGVIQTINQATRMFGYEPEELIGKSFPEFIYEEDRDRIVNAFFEVVAQGKTYMRSLQFRIQTRSGELRWFEANCRIRFDENGKFILQQGVCRDITDRIETQQAMMQAQERLEELIATRTADLKARNRTLQEEIARLRETETNLRQQVMELAKEKAGLEERQTEIEKLLDQKENAFKELEERIMFNIKELIIPYIEKIRELGPGKQELSYLEILENNLMEITSAFTKRMAVELHRLTPSELQVANLIRQGNRSKQIASKLNLSVRTVEAYRNNIRRKLQIKNKKVNLKAYLASLR